MRPFELAVWGPHHAKALQRLPKGVEVTRGPDGALLSFPPTTAPDVAEALFAKLERAQKEGGLFVGLLPDRPLTPAQVRREWASAVRVRNVPLALTKKRPLG